MNPVTLSGYQNAVPDGTELRSGIKMNLKCFFEYLDEVVRAFKIFIS